MVLALKVNDKDNVATIFAEQVQVAMRFRSGIKRERQ